MSIVWVLDSPAGWHGSLAQHLIHEFAVRLFASQQALLTSLQGFTSQQHQPGLIILAESDATLNQAEAILARARELACPCLRIVNASCRTTRSLDAAFAPQGCNDDPLLQVLARPLAAGALNTYLRKLLQQQERRRDPAGLLRYGPLSFDAEQLCLHIAGGAASETLSWKEGRLLKLFMQQPARCLSRSLIKENVWGSVQVSPRTIDSQISRLRKRLAYHGVSIENVYGDGYIFQ